MGANVVQFGQRGRYRVDLYHYAYDLTDAVRLTKREIRGAERDFHGRLRPYSLYKVRCIKCGKSVIIQSRSSDPEFISPPIRLVRLDECKCGCWACGKPIDRGNLISTRGTGQRRTNTRFCSNACRQKAYRRRRVQSRA
jgi:hypothetical protein